MSERRLRHGKIELALHGLRVAEPAPTDGAVQPLLLLHGLGERSPEALPEEFAGWPGDVYALDFVGHGASDLPIGGGYTADAVGFATAAPAVGYRPVLMSLIIGPGQPQFVEDVGQAASVVATHGAVREALLDFQRTFAAEPPGAVLDGRDIGTVVCPEAQVKFYLEATAEVRAERRLCELRSRGVESIESSVLEEIIARDVRDSRRSAAPLKPAADASRIDTTALGPDEVFGQAVAIVDSSLSST